MNILSVLAQQSGTASTARDLLLVLAAAGIAALLMSRLRVTTIPGYLMAGAVIGPHALKVVADPESVQGISQLSTILLLFTVGLQLDMSRVRTGLVSIVGSAVLATALMTLLGLPIAYLIVPTIPGALVLSMAMAISATAAPLRLMEQRRAMHTTYGRIAFGITLFQDLISVAMLATLPVLAHLGGTGGESGLSNDWKVMATTAGKALGGLGAMVLVARFVLPRLLTEAGRVGGEVLIVVSAAMALGAAVLAAWLGFSPELGAFLAGFLLASTPFRFQVAGQLTPMRDLFLAVFFTSVGMSMPLDLAIDGWWIVLLGVVALGLLKMVSITVASWTLGAAAQFGLLAAVMIAPAGEFTLVMIQQSSAAGLLSDEQRGYAIAIVVLSILAAPLIVRLGVVASRLLERVPHAPWFAASPLREEEEAAEGEHKFRAIVAGFGPVGRAVADSLQKNGVAVTVIELNARTVQKQSDLGRRVVFGDASNPQVLESAGLNRADAVILTMPDEEAMLRACRIVRSLRPDVFVAARANALSRALQAMQLGADHAVVEEMVTAEAMASQVLLKVRQRIAGQDTGPKLYEEPGVVR